MDVKCYDGTNESPVLRLVLITNIIANGSGVGTKSTLRGQGKLKVPRVEPGGVLGEGRMVSR